MAKSPGYDVISGNFSLFFSAVHFTKGVPPGTLNLSDFRVRLRFFEIVEFSGVTAFLAV